MFVCKAESSVPPSNHYAQGLGLSFCETHLTDFGGMVLWQRFCNRLGLRRLLQQSLRMSQPNADYHPSDLILALLYAVMAGLRRINKTEIRP